MDAFEIAAGTVAGADHIRAARNSHDAFRWSMTGGAVIAVVCDGCGSAPHSEVGAKLGARLAQRTVADHLGPDFSWSAVERDFLRRLRAIADQVGGASDFFLFTLLAAVITEEVTTVAAAGDGVVMINGAALPLPPVIDNAPRYLGYALLGDAAVSLRPIVSLPTSAVQSVLLATDGASHLDAIEPFWTDDRYFRNPDALRRTLFALNRRPPGRLPDDTTIVAIRRGESRACAVA